MTTTVKDGTLTITYTTTALKLTNILTAAVQYLYPHYPIWRTVNDIAEVIPFAELTNAQKLGIIDQHVKRVIMDAAKTYTAQAAMDTARADAEKVDLTL